MTPLDGHVEGANGAIQAGRYYGRGIPYLPINGYPGKLIAIEGTDGVGRTTQIRLLREWLEVKGYGVVETGWTRSPLMDSTIELAKSRIRSTSNLWRDGWPTGHGTVWDRHPTRCPVVDTTAARPPALLHSAQPLCKCVHPTTR
jgi:hypothetical protein